MCAFSQNGRAVCGMRWIGQFSLLHPTIPRAVDDLHLLRERGGSGGVAWPGVMTSHARMM